MINIINGDLLSVDNVSPIICQQVNHKGIMGAGLAKQIVDKYPLIIKGYRYACHNVEWEYIKTFGYVYWYQAKDHLFANIFGQRDYGRNEDIVYTNYAAFSKGFAKVCEKASRMGVSVSLPYGIACGLANGNWGIIYDIIEYESSKRNINVNIFKFQ